MTPVVAEREVAMPGEATRLAELYCAHGPSAKRLAFLLTGDERLAEDLVQDAFVRMFRRWRHLRSPEAFGSYLRKTVVNLAHDAGRRRRLEQAFLRREEARLETAASGPDLDARDQIWRALQRLPNRQRTAIVLRYYEDLSEQQTAEAMDCAVGSVKSYTSRGLKTLRETFERDRDG